MMTIKPRDAITVERILEQMGVKDFEPRTVNQCLEFIYRYVGDVLEEAKCYERHRRQDQHGNGLDDDERTNNDADQQQQQQHMMMMNQEGNGLSVEDVRLASRVILSREFAANDRFSAEGLQKACARVNEQPMAKILERPGIRVPQDENLLNDNYEIGPMRGPEGVKQMQEARAKELERRKIIEEERNLMLMKLQRAPTAMHENDSKIKFSVTATKKIEITTEKQPLNKSSGGGGPMNTNSSVKVAFEPEEDDYD
jgi:hypothetical protein